MKSTNIFTKAAAVSMVVLASSFFTACSSGSSEKGGVDAGDGAGALGVANRALKEVSYSPNNKGFGYKATGVAADFPAWAKAAKPQIENALNQVGDGYVLQVTGHTCAIGPREAQADGRKGNKFYSEGRAKSVRDALVKAGIPSNKLVVKGVADSETLAGVDPKDQKQRRVTFSLVAAPK